jgi:hypothetical protein
VASTVSGSSGQTPNEGANTSTVVGYGSVTITNGYYDGLSSTARVTINGVNYDQAGPGSMSQGQTYTWNYPVSFGHNANGERAAIGVSVAFYVNGASFHDGSAGAGTQGALNYDRRPGTPTFSTITRTVDAIAVTANTVTSPASTAQYTFTRSENGGSYGDTLTSSSRTTTYSGLTLGSTQNFRVAASNSDGTSGTTTSGTTTVPNVPTAPTITTTAPSGRALNVTAGTSANNGATVSGYFVQASMDDGATWGAPISIPSRVYRFEDLAGGTFVKFRVYSTNEMGNSALTTSVSIFIPSGGRRLTDSGFVATGTFTRLTAGGPIPVGIAKRLTADGWVELS